MEERGVRRCDQDRCATVHYARGMCRKHYARAARGRTWKDVT